MLSHNQVSFCLNLFLYLAFMMQILRFWHFHAINLRDKNQETMRRLSSLLALDSKLNTRYLTRLM
ncbi:hypothetical protein GW17_00047200 [Ensete ventricosum]|nr:hypothetical protein GW17_00047200 [Ensete ventricosum]